MSKPQEPSKCALFCVFYAEFDIQRGTRVCFQSPKRFMDQDIGITTDKIHQILKETFEKKDHRSKAGKTNEIQEEAVDVKADSLSIFESTSDYIITGNELDGQIISLSTHNMHILAKSTTIHNERYKRNSLIFSVGFIIRRLLDPSPFRPILSKLASTFRAMEVESFFLSNRNTRGTIQKILDVILPSLNSRSARCHLLLNDANALHLQYFPPPKIHAPPVPDYVVPVLLRPEYQLQSLEWDLTINWIVPHINGIKPARLIAESSEVDEEMVHASLRVLRHHDVLACVDVFRFSNVYECTSLAQRMLAGEEEVLLQEAFNFVYKHPGHNNNNNSTTASAGGGSAGAGSAGGSIVGFGATGSAGLVSSYRGRIIAPTNSATLSPSSMGDTRTLIPPREVCSSYPPTFDSFVRNGQAAMDGTTPGSYNNSTPISGPALGTPVTNTSGSDMHSSHPFYKKREYQSMLSAIAILYASCQRGMSWGDILLSKVKESSSKNTEDYRGGDDDDFNDDYTTKRKKGTRRTMSFSSGSSAGNDAAIDWREVFDSIYPRRFITFGVIHNLIRRVHEYPIACDIGLCPPCHTIDENAEERRKVVDPNTSKKKKKKKKDSEATLRNLAQQVAASMDGKKCDDELSCTYQKPLHELIELVKKYRRMEVISVYSTAQENNV